MKKKGKIVRKIIINLKDFQSLEDFHTYVYCKFFQPTPYGKNKDAFWDCCDCFDGNEVIIENYSKADQEIKGYIDILKEYEKDNISRITVRIKE